MRALLASLALAASVLVNPVARALPATALPHIAASHIAAPHVAAPGPAATFQPVRERLDSYQRASRRSDYSRGRNTCHSYGYNSRRDRANGHARTYRALGYR